MARFNQIVMTNNGLTLLSKAQTGVQLSFTRMAVGDGVLPTGTDLQNLTGLINQKKSLPINSLAIDGDGNARVRGVITNDGLETGFYIREIGLFATDPDVGEILYCIANAGDYADYLPAAGGAEIVSSTLDFITAVENASNITAIIPAEVYALIQDVNDLSDALGQDMDDLNNALVQDMNNLNDALELHKTQRTSSTNLGHSQVDNTSIEANNGVISVKNYSKIMKTDADQTMTGKLVAKNGTDYGTKQCRNIILSTANPSGGSNGDIWLKYK